MRTLDLVTVAASSLGVNRSRSALTILGIVIGISAVMLTMSIGKGVEALIIGELGGLGAETIIIRPGKEPKGPADIGQTLFADSLKLRDIDALRRKSNVPHVVDLMPVLVVPGGASYQGETFGATVMGAAVDFFSDAFNVYISEGVGFEESDIRQNASVAVIGSKVARELFGESDPLGEHIQIKDRKFRVVGVFAAKGQVSVFNIDEVLIIPYTTAQTYLLGIDYFHEIIVKVENVAMVERSVRDIELTLRENHDISNPDDDDFFVVTQQGIVEQISTILGALTAFLSSVVAIALVVAGVGVMNIMLVAVTERTREIGLRKALGATNSDILNQFLLEAVFLTSAGGIIGILVGTGLGYAASFALSRFLGVAWPFVFPLEAMFIALAVAAGVGLLFGIYPARRASALDPIEALRYE